MANEGKRITPQQIGAWSIGTAVTAASGVLSLLVNPAGLPLDLLLSVGLGGAAAIGALRLLDPASEEEKETQRVEREFRAVLSAISGIGERTRTASQRWCIGQAVAPRLAETARLIEQITERYRQRPRDFAGASRTLTVLQKWDDVQVHYVKVKCNELFLRGEQASKVIDEMEGQTLPTFEEALQSLLQKMDQDQSISAEVHKGTLRDMLDSLGLLRSRKQRGGPAPVEEVPDDTHS